MGRRLQPSPFEQDPGHRRTERAGEVVTLLAPVEAVANNWSPPGAQAARSPLAAWAPDGCPACHRTPSQGASTSGTGCGLVVPDAGQPSRSVGHAAVAARFADHGAMRLVDPLFSPHV